MPESVQPAPGALPGARAAEEAADGLTGAPSVRALDEGAGERPGSEVRRDADGRIVEEISPGGARTTFERDAAGHVTQVTASDGKNTEQIGYTYNSDGLIATVFYLNDPEATKISYTYDTHGNVTQVAYPDGKTLSQTFDNLGQLTSATDAAGAATEYTYNADGTMKSAKQTSATGAPMAEAAYTYDSLGRVISIERGNGVTTRFEYTDLNQPKTEKSTRPDGTVVAESTYTYTYDDENRLIAHARTDHRPAIDEEGRVLEGGKLVTTNAAYRYDDDGWLTHSDLRDAKGNPLLETAYTLNAKGDITRAETTSHTDNGPRTTVTENETDASGKLLSVTVDGNKTVLERDAAGNLLKDARGNTWTYNGLRQPVSVTTPDGKRIAYTYWAEGNRKTTVIGEGEQQSTIAYHYQPGGNTIANDTYTGADGTDAGTASYLIPGTPEARTFTGDGQPTGASGYLLHDGSRNTTAQLADDGTVNGANYYTDYGQVITNRGTPVTPRLDGGAAALAALNPFTYGGQYTDPILGAPYKHTLRTYDPS
ncbi:hypothetical protein [Streptomyces sp. NPDC008121]|uniref:hypothetical protein n=1 Tax=Streptomyces sp. NPDC008121 TaxID=3364809 RepID=UPI0036E974B1